MSEDVLLEKIKNIESIVLQVREQVQTTNGRVSSLEKWKYGFLCAIGTLAATKWPELSTILGVFGGP